MDLFEDQRIYQLPENKRWAIYRNPTEYQKKLNDMTYQINRILIKKGEKQ